MTHHSGRGEAPRVFDELLPEGSLAAVHVYFPDPWWKKRHKKRRVMKESFLREIERTLVAGGTLHFWTDVEEYFQASLELLAAYTSLQGPLDVPEDPAESDVAYRTHFERRMRQHGDPVYRAEFRKPPSAHICCPPRAGLTTKWSASSLPASATSLGLPANTGPGCRMGKV